MTQAFRQLLDLLVDDTLPLNSEDIARLSDLDASESEQFHRLWERVAEVRRLEILRESRKLADAQIELSFESINRLALSDPAPQIRRLAIENLWESEDATLIPPLLHALSDDLDAEVRGSAGDALGNFIYLGEMAKLRPETLHQIEDALLAAAQHDQNGRVRRRSLESLGFSSRSEVSDLILSAYDAGDESSMQTALKAMGRSADNIWAPNVLAQLHHPAPSIRLEAVQAAGELALREAVGEVLELLDDVRDDIRAAAIWSLGQIGGSAAAEALELLSASPRNPEEQELVEAAHQTLTFFEGSRDLLMLDIDEAEDLID